MVRLKKQINLTFDHVDHAKVDQFTKFFHCQITEEIMYTDSPL